MSRFLRIEQKLQPSQITNNYLDIKKQTQQLFERSPNSKRIPIFLDGDVKPSLINLTGWNYKTPMLTGLSSWYKKNGAKAGDLVVFEQEGDRLCLSILKAGNKPAIDGENEQSLSPDTTTPMTSCEKFYGLVSKLKTTCNLDDYSDSKWCGTFETDEHFLHILCWANWLPERQEAVWKEIRIEYKKIGKTLDRYNSKDLQNLANAYPLPWQKKWVTQLVAYLVSQKLDSTTFVIQLKAMGYDKAERKLKSLMQTTEPKIVNCWLRDIVKLDAFPIDSRIRNLLLKEGIPIDSDLIIDCCHENNIPVRNIARALYSNALDF